MSDGKNLLQAEGVAEGVDETGGEATPPDRPKSPDNPEAPGQSEASGLSSGAAVLSGTPDAMSTSSAAGTASPPDDDDYHHEDERSPLAPEDDHSGADFDIAEEAEAKLGTAAEPSLSAPPPPPAPIDAGDDDMLHHVHDDDPLPMECEDDHSDPDVMHDDAPHEPSNPAQGAQAGTTGPPSEGLDSEHVHPGLAAALGASFAYAQNGLRTDDEPSPDDASGQDPVKASADAEACVPLEPEDSGEDDDVLPNVLLCADAPEGGKEAQASTEKAPETVITKEAAIAAAAAGAAAADASSGTNPEDDEEKEDTEDKPMTLRDHLTELRKRLFRAFLWVLLGFVICYPFAEQLFTLLFQPLMKAMPEASKLIYTSPPEAFFTFMKVAFVGGIFCTSPFVFYQIWAFIAPGLYKEEKMYILPVAVFSAVFFMSGGAFCYFVVFPFAFEFFMSYNQGLIQAMPALSETLSFVLQFLLAFGLVFELPLFVFFLARLGIVTADMMRRFRRYAVLVMVIIAAILTPPDVLSQLLMVGPLILLYETSILIAAVFGKKKEAPAKEEDEDEEDEDDEEDDAPRRIETQQEQGQ